MNNDISTSTSIPNNTPNVKQLVLTLMNANTISYPRLQVRLEKLLQTVVNGGNKKEEQQQCADLRKFIQTYRPIDSKNAEFLKQYGTDNVSLLDNLTEQIGEPIPDVPKIAPLLKPKINVKKFGLYMFPFYSLEKLDLGDISIYKTIKTNLTVGSGVHFKLWKDINGIPFLVNGYFDNEYSCVTRVLASQAGKLLGLQCEEVFFGDLNGKSVTMTAFREAITLLENETFQIYQMASNYDYQSEQKRAFYFLIQNWPAYANINGQVRERFERHYIDSKGNILLSQHDQCSFLTPQQMATNLMVKLVITKDNYRPIKDLIIKIGDKDIADIVFSSIPINMIEEHDKIAESLNKPNFDQRRESFDSNWERLKEAMYEFENSFGLLSEHGVG